LLPFVSLQFAPVGGEIMKGFTSKTAASLTGMNFFHEVIDEIRIGEIKRKVNL